MNQIDFTTTRYGKCILAGEHSVLRGQSAIVVPLKSFDLTIQYHDNHQRLSGDVQTAHGETLLILLWSTLQTALKLLNKDIKSLDGEFNLINNLSPGSGLGFSSSLCIAVSDFLIWKKWLPPENLFCFSHALENTIHGKSSGVDVAGALAKQPILYQKNHIVEEIETTWQPHLYLSYTNSTATTAECIAEVEKLLQKDNKLGNQLDLQMQHSVDLCQQALIQEKDIYLLQNALEIGADCFHKWGLITPEMETCSNELLKNGALAVKPTGSGKGGYILSLWKESPHSVLSIPLIRVF